MNPRALEPTYSGNEIWKASQTKNLRSSLQEHHIVITHCVRMEAKPRKHLREQVKMLNPHLRGVLVMPTMCLALWRIAPRTVTLTGSIYFKFKIRFTRKR